MKLSFLYPVFPPKPIREFICGLGLALKRGGGRQAFKELLRYTIVNLLPRAIGALLLPLGLVLKNKKIFLQLNLDHFGPIIYAHLFQNSRDYDPEKTYFIMAKDFPSKGLLKSLPSNIRVLDRPWQWVVYSGLFFCRPCSFYINVHHASYRENYSLKQPEMSCLSQSVKKIAPLKQRSSSSNRPEFLKEWVGDSRYIVLYGREPGWEMSVGRSRRNLNLKSFKEFLNKCHTCGIKVIRYGGSYMRPAVEWGIAPELLIDYATSPHCTPENDLHLWENCSGVIGSMSGATHVPSLLYGKPTLYIGFVPVHHIVGFHGLLQGTGTIDQELDTYYGLPIVKKHRGELDLSQRLLMERDAADPYQDCEIAEVGSARLAALGTWFLGEIGMLERRDEPYIGYEIKVDYTSLGERQILASSSNKGNIFLI